MKDSILKLIREGVAIPALPLALNEDKSWDLRNQRRLVHYYLDAGAGGIAACVHTTQFEVRKPKYNLYRSLLEVTIEEIAKRDRLDSFVKVAGVCGSTPQAIEEASIAKEVGYDVALLSYVGLNDLSEEELLEHTRQIAKIMPVFGFYLQPSVGGKLLSFDFWSQFSEIDNVIGIKAAPFNRYFTHDVMRAVAHSSRRNEITLYTGNDDNIVMDLASTYTFDVDGEEVKIKFEGGLLGHWAVDTFKSVQILKRIKSGKLSLEELTILNAQVTDANSAYFDVAHSFKGSIAGINDVLARQGLLKGNWCLEDKEVLSPNQAEEITRVRENYPDLCDDDFIKLNIQNWDSFVD